MIRRPSSIPLLSGWRVAACTLAITAGLLTTGCATDSTGEPATVSPLPLTHSLSGNVHGGQQPVSGSAVYLFATGTTGYQSASTSLLNTSASGIVTDSNGNGYVTTGSSGNFTITNAYTCPSSTAQVYMLATGGNPGLSPGANNFNLAMLTALGNCGNLTSGTFIQINEVTSVAAVWALSPFMLDSLNIGAPTTNAAGIAEAFNGAAQMANSTTGLSPGAALPAGASISVTEINTLADILASCINSNGGTSGDGSACGNLFAAAPTFGGIAPYDTLTAALAIARSPTTNVASLFALSNSTAPFQPSLSSSPNDWTISAQYAPTGLISPQAVALDASGHVWIADCGSANCSTPGTGKVFELTSDGSTLGSTAAGIVNVPKSLAVDLSGNVWVPNFAVSTVTELNPSTLTAAASPFTGGGLNAPNSIAIDATGQAWIMNTGNSTVTVLNSTGAPLTPSTGYSGVSVPGPISVLINPH